ncbi:MAG: HipA domain-containing protein [Candidatus Delongbacteria bacterium]|jgi:serine/threonine-protein kinase HipA|nr:HipA domain-containing protein [Candidatus Delongbacteria bacterium]MDY0017398.1 HipA domain-containing protein [Candidatus Delongbacteria bacterium]
MNRCPITYAECENRYSSNGLSKLSPRLSDLIPLPFTAQEQRMEAVSRAVKMSVQGVQPKLSARLSVKEKKFEVVDQNGTFIIKPQSDLYLQVPENEDLTMKMADAFGIEVPLTGLVYSKDGSLSYFIKRFDRYAKTKKHHVEDFAQLTENTRDTKYNWSMEKLIPVLDKFCSFPMLEKRKLFRRVLFCFLTGNEDMHLKNFSLITRNSKVELSPAYDLLNTTIATGKAVEELALPLAGKKSRITKKLLFDYYATDRMNLNKKTVNSEIQNLINKKQHLEKLIGISFLSAEMKKKYLELLNERYERIFS